MRASPKPMETSPSPPLTLTLMELAASCWMTLAFDCAKTRSILMSAAAKNPLLMPMMTGHRLVEPDETEPAMMVSAARAAVSPASEEDEARPRQKERAPMVPSLNKPLPQE